VESSFRTCGEDESEVHGSGGLRREEIRRGEKVVGDLEESLQGCIVRMLALDNLRAGTTE
jgi:hypothetical protein